MALLCTEYPVKGAILGSTWNKPPDTEVPMSLAGALARGIILARRDSVARAGEQST